MKNIVQSALKSGGTLTPIIVPSNLTNGTGIFNPSIYNDNGNLLMNIRHCQVTIYHSEKNKFEHQWGPLTYLNPENDITLTTTNYFTTVNPQTLMVDKIWKVDFSKFDAPPLWEFRGLEDCRVVRWDNKLYVCGVRRDTTTNGQGRMELSEVQFQGEALVEVSRFRIPAPPDDSSYCEKNWMPVTDMPYHFVKWSNPTQVVKVDVDKKTCETVHLDMSKYVQFPYDFRGGSQVIPIGPYRMCISHVVNLFWSEQGRKNATYRHCFIIWDKEWNVVKYGEPFTFMNNEIEFCAGMTRSGNDLLITFGVRDNAAYLLKAPLSFIEEFLNG